MGEWGFRYVQPLAFDVREGVQFSNRAMHAIQNACFRTKLSEAVLILNWRMLRFFIMAGGFYVASFLIKALLGPNVSLGPHKSWRLPTNSKHRSLGQLVVETLVVSFGWSL